MTYNKSCGNCKWFEFEGKADGEGACLSQLQMRTSVKESDIACSIHREKEGAKLLYPFSGVLGVFFPVGRIRNGGTCEFANDVCLEECVAFKNATDENRIGYEVKEAAYRFIIQQPLHIVCQKIVEEIKEAGGTILYWFAAGDCVREYTKRIVEVIKYLSTVEVIQCGFTRNLKLWEQVIGLKNVHLVLTVRSKEEAEAIKHEGMVAVPDYKKTIIELYKMGYAYGSCGGGWYELSGRKRMAADCTLCCERKEGCFTE